MDTKYIVFIALVTVTLVGTVAIATDSAFATENNQVISQDCGSELESLNTGCLNTASQIEGDEHAVSLASQQTFEEEEENTPAPPGQQSITPSIVLPH